MMPEIIDVQNTDSKINKKILFDTNIWIYIQGFTNPSKHKSDIYSAAYKRILELGQTVVVNDYVLGEFCNRCARYEYELAKASDPSLDSFKRYRRTGAFLPVMESIRDTCLNIIDECEFVPVAIDNSGITSAIEDACRGDLDLSDLVLAKYCADHDFYLLTDDADYAKGCAAILTANPKLVKMIQDKK